MNTHSIFPGTFHGDELTCLFYSNLMKPEVVPGGREEKAINTMCSLWTEFAASGNPSPLWPKYTAEDGAYLNIGEDLVPSKNFRSKELKVWRDIFNLINNVPTNKL